MACNREQEDLFSESSALRLNHAIQDAKEVLMSSENGWIMEYFPTNESAGETLLMKFNKNGMATIAAQNQYFPTYTEDNSTFDVIGDNGPVITFNSYNEVLHMFSNPVNPSGLGLKGDYEFIILETENDIMKLKGKKRGVTILLHKLSNEQDWKEYFTQLNNMESSLFNNILPVTWLLSSNNSYYELKNGNTHIFTAKEKKEGVFTEDFNIPFIVTNYGIRFVQPFELGGKELQEFKLSDDKSSLIPIDEDANVNITGPSLTDFYFDALNNNRKMALLSEEENMSPSVKSIYEKIKMSTESFGRKLTQIAFYTSKTYGKCLLIRTYGTGNADGNFSFSMNQVSNSEIELIFNGFQRPYDVNAKRYYDEYEGVSELIDLIQGNYKISSKVSDLNPTLLRCTNVANENIWFDLNLIKD